MFDIYQKSLPVTQQIQSVYLYNSRKVNQLAQRNQTDFEYLKAYFTPHVHDGKLFLVDEGWHASSQHIITELLSVETYGYYLGVMKNINSDPRCHKEGILFYSADGKNYRSKSGVFRSNCTFYEQILSAPHGSLQKYERCDGEIKPVLFWTLNEEQIYCEYVKNIQTGITERFKLLLSWDCNINEKSLAKMYMKSLLFWNTDARLKTLREIENGWVDNINPTPEKNFERRNDIQMNISHMIIKPYDYMRYFGKLKEYIHSNFIYIPLSRLVYGYCRMMMLFRT